MIYMTKRTTFCYNSFYFIVKISKSNYDVEEAEKHFKDMKILFKENRILERIFEGEKIKQGYIDYIVQKYN